MPPLPEVQPAFNIGVLFNCPLGEKRKSNLNQIANINLSKYHYLLLSVSTIYRVSTEYQYKIVSNGLSLVL